MPAARGKAPWPPSAETPAQRTARIERLTEFLMGIVDGVEGQGTSFAEILLAVSHVQARMIVSLMDGAVDQFGDLGRAEVQDLCIQIRERLNRVINTVVITSAVKGDPSLPPSSHTH